MITLNPDVFYLKPVYKKILLLILGGMYLYFLNQGVSFQSLSFFFLLPFVAIILVHSERGVKRIIFNETDIQVDELSFAYSDLVSSRVAVEFLKSTETKGIGIELKFVLNGTAHWFHVTVTEANKEKKWALVESINKLISAKIIPQTGPEDILKEKETNGRYFLIALSVALGVYLTIWAIIQFSSLGTYDGNELNQYFYIPLLVCVLFYHAQFYLLSRTSVPFYKLSPSARKRLTFQHQGISLLLGGVGYLVALQGLYWFNRYVGLQENLTEQVKVLSADVRQGKGCHLTIYVEHPKLSEPLKLHDECKRYKNYPVGKTFELGFFRGSLGGFYFK